MRAVGMFEYTPTTQPPRKAKLIANLVQEAMPFSQYLTEHTKSNNPSDSNDSTQKTAHENKVKSNYTQLFKDYPKNPSLDDFIEYLKSQLDAGSPVNTVSEDLVDFAFAYLLDKNGNIKSDIIQILVKHNIIENKNEPEIISSIIKSFVLQLIIPALAEKSNEAKSPQKFKTAVESTFTKMTADKIEEKLLPVFLKRNTLCHFGEYCEKFILSKSNSSNSSNSSSNSNKVIFKDFLMALSNEKNSAINNLPKEIEHIVTVVAQRVEKLNTTNDDKENESEIANITNYLFSFIQHYLLDPEGKINSAAKELLIEFFSDGASIEFESPEIIKQLKIAFVNHIIALIKLKLNISDADQWLKIIKNNAIQLAEEICDSQKNNIVIPNYYDNNSTIPNPYATRLSISDPKLIHTTNTVLKETRENDWSIANQPDPSFYRATDFNNLKFEEDFRNPNKKEIYFDYIDNPISKLLYKVNNNGEMKEGEINTTDIDQAHFEAILAAYQKPKAITNDLSILNTQCTQALVRLLSNRGHLKPDTQVFERDAERYSILIDGVRLEKGANLKALMIQKGFTEDEITSIKSSYRQPNTPLSGGLNGEYALPWRFDFAQNVYKRNNEIFFDFYSDNFVLYDLTKGLPPTQPDAQIKLPGNVKLRYKLIKPTFDDKGEMKSRSRLQLEWVETSNTVLTKICLSNNNVVVTPDAATINKLTPNDVVITENKIINAQNQESKQTIQKTQSDRLSTDKDKLLTLLRYTVNTIKALEITQKPSSALKYYFNSIIIFLNKQIKVLANTLPQKFEKYYARFKEEQPILFDNLNGQLKHSDLSKDDKKILIMLSDIFDAIAPNINNKIIEINNNAYFKILNQADHFLKLKPINSAISSTTILDKYNEKCPKNTGDNDINTRMLSDNQLTQYYLKEYAKTPPKDPTLINDDSDEENSNDSQQLPDNENSKKIWTWLLLNWKILDFKFKIPIDDLIELKEAFIYLPGKNESESYMAAFEQSLKISNTILHFKKKLINKESLAPDLVAFYTNTIDELRSVHGKIKTYLYFDSKFSTFDESNNPTNGLIEYVVGTKMSNSNASVGMTFNLDNFITHLNDNCNPALNIAPKINNFFGVFNWLSWYFDDKNDLKEEIFNILNEKTTVELRRENKKSQIAAESPFSHLDKIQSIRSAAEKKLTLFSKSGDSNYYAIAFKAELSCVLKDFSQGHLDESGLLMMLTQMNNYYNHKLMGDDVSLLNTLNEVYNKFNNAYGENEAQFYNIQPKSDLKISNNELHLKNRNSLILKFLIDSHEKTAKKYPIASKEMRATGLEVEEKKAHAKGKKLAKIIQFLKTCEKNNKDTDANETDKLRSPQLIVRR